MKKDSTFKVHFFTSIPSVAGGHQFVILENNDDFTQYDFGYGPGFFIKTEQEMKQGTLNTGKIYNEYTEICGYIQKNIVHMLFDSSKMRNPKEKLLGGYSVNLNKTEFFKIQDYLTNKHLQNNVIFSYKERNCTYLGIKVFNILTNNRYTIQYSDLIWQNGSLEINKKIATYLKKARFVVYENWNESVVKKIGFGGKHGFVNMLKLAIRYDSFNPYVYSNKKINLFSLMTLLEPLNRIMNFMVEVVSFKKWINNGGKKGCYKRLKRLQVFTDRSLLALGTLLTVLIGCIGLDSITYQVAIIFSLFFGWLGKDVFEVEMALLKPEKIREDSYMYNIARNYFLPFQQKGKIQTFILQKIGFICWSLLVVHLIFGTDTIIAKFLGGKGFEGNIAFGVVFQAGLFGAIWKFFDEPQKKGVFQQIISILLLWFNVTPGAYMLKIVLNTIGLMEFFTNGYIFNLIRKSCKNLVGFNKKLFTRDN